MANKGGRRSSGSDNSSLILGVLIGMVLGLLVAGGVAWHLANRPKAFALKDTREPTPAAAPAKSPVAVAPPAARTPAASAVGSDGKRFTFYEILSKGHPNATVPAHGAATAVKPTAAGNYFLQAGSFAKADEADRLKAKIALMGMEASVQQADVPGKGTYYRVRLGPYHTADEMNKANTTLKQNGIAHAAPVRGTR